MKKITKVILGIIAFVVVLAICAVIIYFAHSNQPTVSAQGTSTLNVQPDEISISVAIETQSMNVQTAQKQNINLTNIVISALENMGINESNIQYSSYSNYPNSVWNGQSYVNNGSTVEQDLIIKTMNFSNTLDVINSVVNNGALVQSISFDLSDQKQNEYKNQALQAASEDARGKAESIANGQNMNLWSLVSVSSDDFNYVPLPIYSAAAGASAMNSNAKVEQVAANISPSELQVSESVTVEYRLTSI